MTIILLRMMNTVIPHVYKLKKKLNSPHTHNGFTNTFQYEYVYPQTYNTYTEYISSAYQFTYMSYLYELWALHKNTTVLYKKAS